MNLQNIVSNLVASQSLQRYKVPEWMSVDYIFTSCVRRHLLAASRIKPQRLETYGWPSLKSPSQIIQKEDGGQ